MTDDLQDKAEALAISSKLIPGTAVDEVQVTWEGLVGDRHFGLTMKSSSSQKLYAKGIGRTSC